MTYRRPQLAVWALAALVLLLLLVGTLALSVSDLGWSVERLFLVALAVVFLGVGALIAIRHPGNAIGWIFLFVAVSSSVAEASYGYVQYWLSRGGLGGWGEVSAAYTNVSWIPFILVPATFLLLLFPDGHLLSPRWRPIAWSAGVGIAGAFVTTFVTPGPIEDLPQLVNRFGWRSPLLGPLTGLAFLVLMVGIIGSSLSLILRFRRARGEQRLQMKWLAFAGVLAAITFPIALAGYEIWGEAISNAAFMLSVLGLPAAAGVGILRYRLYEIDVVVNRTLVYGVLTALLAFFYLGAVVVLQALLQPITADSDIAIAGSTLAVAAAFRPLRGRVQGFIDRRFYRSKYDAADTLGRFTARLRDQVDLDSLGRELVEVVGTTMQPVHASLWLRSDESL